MMIKSRSKTVFVLFAALLILAVSLTAYINQLNADLRSAMDTEIVENSMQNATIISTKFSEKFVALTGLADFISSNGSLSDKKVTAAMQAATKSGQFSHISVADIHGDGISDTGFRSNIAGYDFFEASLSGRNTISNEPDLPLYSNNQFSFSVPVYQNKTIIGVLRGAIAIDQMNNIGVSVPSNGNYYLIKRDGSIVFNSKGSNLQNSDQTIFSVLSGKNHANANKIDLMRKNIGLSVSGMMDYQTGDSQSYLYYMPLNVSDWYLVTIIPDTVTLSRFRYIFSGSGFLAAGTVSAFALLGVYAILLLRRKNNDIKKSSQELKTLTANIPGCVKRCKYDSNFTMIYCSDGFLQLTGYTRDEVNEFFEDKYINMIYKLDREEVRFNIDKQLQAGEVIDIQYRLLKKDGSLVWTYDKGQLIIELGMEPEFYSVLVDITCLKETIQELEISNERYQIVMDQSDSTIFEYNILNDVVSMGKNDQNLSGGSFQDFLKNISCSLFSGDVNSFKSMFANVRAGAHSAEGEYRLKNTKSSYLWYDINITTIFDQDNRPVRAIGTIRDITFQKEATQTLMEKAERDALTGLLNKSTTKSFIEEALKCDCLCALYMIDVDYFKNVNDSLGHLFGDTVLADIGDKLKKLFRTSDVVGRIGGDEFMVLLKNIGDTSLITEKAAAINCCLRQTFGSGADQCTISGSVGVALYPEDGKTYSDLYKKADIALYQAKRAGRNRYVLFNNAESLQLESCEECYNTLTPTLEGRENPYVNP